MTGRGERPEDFRDLIDGYCSGQIGEDGLRRLEAHLRVSEPARREFVAYFQMHTELQFVTRARRAASAVLDLLAVDPGRAAADPGPPPLRARFRVPALRLTRWSALAAGALIALVGYAAGQHGRPEARAPRPTADPAAARATGANVAWLVNAQDCRWEGGEAAMPGRDMRAGKTLRLQTGLAEIEFDRGARLILRGPAGLGLVSGNEARLLYGSLTARVPPSARGFTVSSPRGKVVDLGTEFGLSVDARGATAVRVFEGTVEASPLDRSAAAGAVVTLREQQAARIDGPTVTLKPTGDDTSYVRAIVPPADVIPRVLTIDFARPAAGTLPDAEGAGTGLTHRLPGTGGVLPGRDPNLRLIARRGVLELTTTRSDINQQVGMPTGEYLGFRLSDLGFTGAEDFAVTVTIPDIPGLERVGQFGLYAGTWSDRNIRGGLISQPEPDRYNLFLVNNDGGRDSDLYEVGLMSRGDDLRLTLRRTGGAYSLVVENLTQRNSGTLSIAHPAFLDGERDLYVGLFGANTQSDVRKTLTIRELAVKVWSSPPAARRAASRPG
jgi:hypothetical protein